jgi:mannose-6-phosphate isomerase-like protein (cupin superfamily)
LKRGELLVVPKGVEHKPSAEKQCEIRLYRSIHRKLHLDQIEECLSNRNATEQPDDK